MIWFSQIACNHSMEITVTETTPTMKGTTYETRYLYTGFGRVNEHEKTLEVLQKKDGKIIFFTRPFMLHVLSRVYHVELARVTIYSSNPRMWSEEVDGVTFFMQPSN